MTTAPALTDGWDLQVGEGDSLLRRFVHHHAATAAAFVAASGGRVHAREGLHVADAGRPAGFWNAATLLRPPRDWDETIETVLRLTSGGSGEVLVWSAWPTPDLTASGLELLGHPPLLVRPPHALVPATAAPSGATTPEIEEVVTAPQLAEWERVAVDGYPLPDVGDVVGSVGPPAILADPRVRCWLGRVDGRAVSIGTSFVSHGLASLALGVSLPGARGRGHWRAHATTRLRAFPHLWTAGIFSDDSRPLAESLGFVPITRFTLWRLPRH